MMKARRPTLGIITNNQHHVFQRNIIAGLQEVTSARGYEVVVDSIAEDARHPQPVSLDINAMSGVLVISNVVPDEFLRDLYRTGKPLSLVSHQIADTPIPAVIPNNTEGIAKLVGHVVNDCGRRKLVFIGGDLNQNDGIQRDYVFRQELLRYNLNVDEAFMLRGDFAPDIAAASVRQLLQTTRDFDAVIAADYLMAIAAMNVLQEHGLQIPKDVCVIGFGDGPEAAESGLTTVAANEVELGRRCARQLIGQIEGLRIRGFTVLSTQLVKRTTCC